MKQLLARDSDRLIVIDDKVKHKSLWEILLYVLCFMSMMTLTIWGLLQARAVQAIGEKIDLYVSQHPNLIPSILTGFVVSVIGVYGVWWLGRKLRG